MKSNLIPTIQDKSLDDLKVDENDRDILIESLNKQIDLLRSELENKNEIIQILIKVKYVSNCSNNETQNNACNNTTDQADRNKTIMKLNTTLAITLLIKLIETKQ